MRVEDWLEDFGQTSAITGPLAEEGTDALAGFEDGYKAGWDDAVAAQTETGRRISGDLAQNLQDLSFTYHEALAQVTKSLAPVMEQIVELLLPQMVQQSLGLQLIQFLTDRGQQALGADVVITVAPHDLETVQSLLQGDYGIPLRIEGAGHLASGQADLRLEGQDHAIDLRAVADGLAEQVQAFLDSNAKDLKHGSA